MRLQVLKEGCRSWSVLAEAVLMVDGAVNFDKFEADKNSTWLGASIPNKATLNRMFLDHLVLQRFSELRKQQVETHPGIAWRNRKRKLSAFFRSAGVAWRNRKENHRRFSDQQVLLGEIGNKKHRGQASPPQSAFWGEQVYPSLSPFSNAKTLESEWLGGGGGRYGRRLRSWEACLAAQRRWKEHVYVR
ncbi:hypothetical protein BSKO_12993 [Bryopsis sp. KO-2023]|nr:hypothetical protein BSKO_12993 [Bryopsis sp. KO-2023]